MGVAALAAEDIRRLYEHHCGDLFKQELGITRTIVAYSRPPNLGEYITQARFHQPLGDLHQILWGSINKDWLLDCSPFFFSMFRRGRGCTSRKRRSFLFRNFLFYFIAYSTRSFLEGNYTPTEEVSFGRILLPMFLDLLLSLESDMSFQSDVSLATFGAPDIGHISTSRARDLDLSTSRPLDNSTPRSQS